ncbi:MAG TPA: hypothetical protein VK400_16585 [Pyrinomonadaceae bacterium]|nr:hypothetical protein [Pyrinomonadaceae bacterium]
MSELAINDYTDLLEDVKHRVRQAQIKAALSINREIIFLYWQIGCEILQRQKV